MNFTFNPKLQLAQLGCNTGSFVVIDNFLRDEDFLKLVNLIARTEMIEKDRGTKISPWTWRFSSNGLEGIITSEDVEKKEQIQAVIDRNYLRDQAGDISIHYSFFSLRPCRKDSSDGDNFTEEPGAFCNRTGVPDTDRPCALCAFARFLKGPAFREFARLYTRVTLTPEQKLSYALTKYSKDSFISPHTDVSNEPGYALTFILYLNVNWHIDWSGSLAVQLTDSRWHEIAPIANRLVLFKPDATTVHRVNPTSSSSKTSRYAISGWFLT